MAELAWSTGDDDREVLHIVGEVDMAVVDELLGQALDRLGHSDRGIDLDFAEVTFIDSSGLGVLVRLRNEAESAHKSLRLRNVSDPVIRVLRVTGLGDFFDVEPAAG
jgi:anti-anti-sigma factor